MEAPAEFQGPFHAIPLHLYAVWDWSSTNTHIDLLWSSSLLFALQQAVQLYNSCRLASRENKVRLIVMRVRPMEGQKQKVVDLPQHIRHVVEGEDQSQPPCGEYCHEYDAESMYGCAQLKSVDIETLLNHGLLGVFPELSQPFESLRHRVHELHAEYFATVWPITPGIVAVHRRLGECFNQYWELPMAVTFLTLRRRDFEKNTLKTVMAGFRGLKIRHDYKREYFEHEENVPYPPRNQKEVVQFSQLSRLMGQAKRAEKGLRQAQALLESHQEYTLQPGYPSIFLQQGADDINLPKVPLEVQDIEVVSQNLQHHPSGSQMDRHNHDGVEAWRTNLSKYQHFSFNHGAICSSNNGGVGACDVGNGRQIASQKAEQQEEIAADDAVVEKELDLERELEQGLGMGLDGD